MGYDEMNFDELEEIRDVTDTKRNDVLHALEKIIEMKNDLNDYADDEDIDHILDIIEELKDRLGEKNTSLKDDLDEIDNHMQILEDAYDEFGERNSEYWADQF